MKIYKPKKENVIKLEVYLNKIKDGKCKNIRLNTSNRITNN
jgi:DNA-binding Xre family transcriptional regulator